MLIKLKSRIHRGNPIVQIIFPYNEAVKRRVLGIPGRQYSKTLRSFYIKASEFDQAALSQSLEPEHQIEWINNGQVSGGHGFKNEGLIKIPPGFKWNDEQKAALNRMKEHLVLKNYSDSTRKTYLSQFSLFLYHYNDLKVHDLDETAIKNYLLELIEKQHISISKQNQIINAIKYYFEKVEKLPRKTYFLDRPFKEKKLPRVLSEEEVIGIFRASDNLKHRLALMMIYSNGLRRSELINLKVNDIDFIKKKVWIRGGKGRKDRYTILSEKITEIIKVYLNSYCPEIWLVEGVNRGQYSGTSLQNILKRASAKAGIKRNVTLHMLRHSYATHLLEKGVDIRYIQVLLGHNSVRTTQIYTHVSTRGMEQIKSPLDHMDL
ncbi:MAG: tyrosine-type recombinase/integrase [Candidatus Cyclobacteriaceae bacterium M3_2C_046]